MLSVLILSALFHLCKSQLSDSLPQFPIIVPPNPGECRLTQFKCSTGKCIHLSTFCDGSVDCEDGSDEPLYCTPCNRTYFGERGNRHRLSIPYPGNNQLPFSCHLTFTPETPDLQDILQLYIERASIGQLENSQQNQCVKGIVEIWEGDRPLIPAKRTIGPGWCGKIQVPRVLYSEATAVTVVFRINAEGTTKGSLSSSSTKRHDDNFMVDLSYKFVPRTEAPTRYLDPILGPKFLGELLPGTGCSRALRNCDTKNCVVQSPGYPGLYPRGAHCLYRINIEGGNTESEPISIKLSQKSQHKINLKNDVQNICGCPHNANFYYDAEKLNLNTYAAFQWPVISLRKDPDSQAFAATYGRFYERRLRTWHECNVTQDHVNIYDGYSTNFPLLLRFCGSGHLPPIVSSGSDLLVELKTSMFATLTSNFTQMMNLIEGFEMDVSIVRKRWPFPQEGRCEYLITRMDGESGTIRSPAQTIPPNTVCQYSFQGEEGDVVRIYFLKYHLSTPREYYRVENETCRFALRIWNGKKPTSLLSLFTNGSILGSYCKDRPPPTCERLLINETESGKRPCSLDDVFVSSSNILTLTQNIPEATAFNSLDFIVRYHFVNVKQSGERLSSTQQCSRIFYSTIRGEVVRTGEFSSPNNIFLYGISGARNLTCTYRFQGRPNERIRITLNKMKTGKRLCNTVKENTPERTICQTNQSRAELAFVEYPWNNVPLKRDCVCGERTTPTLFVSQTNQVEVKFFIEEMNFKESHEDYFFTASYEFFLTEKPCELRSAVSGVGGPLTLNCRDSKSGCDPQRWLLSPRPGRFAYISVPGYLAKPNEKCSSDTLVVYSASSGNMRATVCPDEYAKHQRVELYSEAWNSSSTDQSSNALILECSGKESSSIRLRWLEIAKRPSYIPSTPILPDENSTEGITMTDELIRNKLKDIRKRYLCPAYCPELQACMDPSVICDGVLHCPSGADEKGPNCTYYAWWESPKIYWYLGAGGASLILLALVSLCSVFIMRLRKKRKAEENKKKFSKHVEFNLNPYDKKLDIS